MLFHFWIEQLYIWSLTAISCIIPMAITMANDLPPTNLLSLGWVIWRFQENYMLESSQIIKQAYISIHLQLLWRTLPAINSFKALLLWDCYFRIYFLSDYYLNLPWERLSHCRILIRHTSKTAINEALLGRKTAWWGTCVLIDV